MIIRRLEISLSSIRFTEVEMEDEYPHPLFIKDLIRRVHEELYESRREREDSGQAAIFQVSALTLEVNFVVVQGKGFKGGVDFRVITAGADKTFQQQQVQKVTLSLSALPGGEPDTKDLELPVTESGFRPREVDEVDE
jgi:hypothetical protein